MDLILYNGNIVTMDKGRPRAEAAAAADGKLAAVGNDREILALRSKNTELVDLQGKTAVPGFNDSHLHLLKYALSLDRVDLSGCRGRDEITYLIKERLREKGAPEDRWVLGWGWNQTFFADQRMPTREDLDRVSPDLCIVILRICNHLCVANTKALQTAGIFENPPAVEGGKIDTDEQGVPTGVLKENAVSLVLGKAPQAGGDALKRLIMRAAADFLTAGLTSAQSDDLAELTGDFRVVLNAYRELDSANRLPLRINKQLRFAGPEQLRSFLAMGYKTGDGGDFFKIGPLKLLLDGSLGGRTAALSEPYADEPGSTGIPIYTPEEIEQLAGPAHANGLQLSAHAIGDRAMEMALDAYEQAQRQLPHEEPRFRIIHASIARADLLERFRALDVIADIQPAFVSSDLPFVEARLGRERAQLTYCWRTFLDRGIRLAGGSDCPIESFNPLLGIYSAVTRQERSGGPRGGWMPEQKLTVAEALEAFTLGSAYASCEERIKGSLVPGKLADVAVLGEDIFRIDPSEIKDVGVVMTVVGGNVAYCAG